MREQFEKLPEIAARIEKSEAFYCPKGDWYLSPHDDCREDEAFLDGAYYAFQDQQKKLQYIYDDCTEYTTVSELLDSIRSILK